jgi:hypothetical protein
MTSIASTAVLFLLAWGLYVIYSAIWGLHLSPIARFPGPKLAALTQWYEMYYDIVKGGIYVWKIGEHHEEYGTPLLSPRTSRLLIRDRTNHPHQPMGTPCQRPCFL